MLLQWKGLHIIRAPWTFDFRIAGMIEMNGMDNHFRLSRRNFLHRGALVLGAMPMIRAKMPQIAGQDKPVRFGLVTDLHYADKANAGTRCYRETLDKLAEAALQFQKDEIEFLVELGDFIDAANSVSLEKQYLKTVNQPFKQICDERFYVLGNHCVDTLNKQEFLGEVGQAKSYFSFDRSGIHFVVLDSCFRSDGKPYERKNFEWTDANIPEDELEWLRDDLKATDSPVVVFAHQRLDVDGSYGVRNNIAVREVLESNGNVVAVFQGHSHKNELKEISGIRYCTMVAMVEGSGLDHNGYSTIEILPEGSIVIHGFRKQESRRWGKT